jgi:hypothetical protein
MYLGDFATGAVVYVDLNTVDPTGAAVTLGGSPAAAVYKDNGTTESTAGVTLTVDFDARTGLHLVAVNLAADGTFYAAGHEFRIVLTGGTSNSVSLAGRVVGRFSIQNRYSSAGPTANQNADALLDRTDSVETGLTLRGALRIIASACAGKVSGAGTATVTFRNAVGDSKNRIVATVDSSGNRSTVTTDAT